MRLLNNPHYAASCTFTTWSRPRFLLLAIVHQVISQKINNKNTGGPIYSLWSSSTLYVVPWCASLAQSRKETHDEPLTTKEKKLRKVVYNLLSSYGDHHHNIWTSQERRSKTIIPDPHMYNTRVEENREGKRCFWWRHGGIHMNQSSSWHGLTDEMASTKKVPLQLLFHELHTHKKKN